MLQSAGSRPVSFHKMSLKPTLGLNLRLRAELQFGGGAQSLSDARLCDPINCSPLLCPWNFPGKSTEMVCHFPLQGIFLT